MENASKNPKHQFRSLGLLFDILVGLKEEHYSAGAFLGWEWPRIMDFQRRQRRLIDPTVSIQGNKELLASKTGIALKSSAIRIIVMETIFGPPV